MCTPAGWWWRQDWEFKAYLCHIVSLSTAGVTIHKEQMGESKQSSSFQQLGLETQNCCLVRLVMGKHTFITVHEETPETGCLMKGEKGTSRMALQSPQSGRHTMEKK